MIAISGIQKEVSEEPVTVLVPGEYYMKNGTHYIRYQQYDENNNSIINNTMKIKGEVVELKKTGSVIARMHFERGKDFVSYYDADGFGMMIQTHTSQVIVKENENSLEIRIYYQLYMNEQYVSSCGVTVTVAERSEEES